MPVESMVNATKLKIHEARARPQDRKIARLVRFYDFRSNLSSIRLINAIIYHQANARGAILDIPESLKSGREIHVDISNKIFEHESNYQRFAPETDRSIEVKCVFH